MYTSQENFVDKLAYQRTTRKFSAPDFSGRASVDTVMGTRGLSTAFGAMKLDAELSRFRLAQFGAATLGALQLAGQGPGGVNYEARFEKNVVESAASLKHHVTYSAYTLAGDVDVTPRFVLAGVAGRFDFSDDNRRSLLRAKAIYVLSETWGVSAYAKTRATSNSRPHGTNYFSPDDFRDYLAGLRIRQRVGSLHGVASAYVEAGRQNVDGVRSPVQGWQVRLEAFPSKPWYYDLSFGRQTSAEGALSQAGNGANYAYRTAKAAVVWPL
jgi:hypothetical protein